MHLHVWFIYTQLLRVIQLLRLLRKNWFMHNSLFDRWEICRERKPNVSNTSIYLLIYLLNVYKCDWVSVLWCDIDGLFFLSLFLSLSFLSVSMFLLLFLVCSCASLFTAHSSFRFVGNSSPFQLCSDLFIRYDCTVDLLAVMK